jgi:hypothetical protein
MSSLPSQPWTARSAMTSEIVIRDYLRSLPERQFPELPVWRFDV